MIPPPPPLVIITIIIIIIIILGLLLPKPAQIDQGYYWHLVAGIDLFSLHAYATPQNTPNPPNPGLDLCCYLPVCY